MFHKSEAKHIDQIEPESLRKKIIEIWPTAEKSKITDDQLKKSISTKMAFDPKFREYIKTLNLN